jgi:hypothetical protein
MSATETTDASIMSSNAGEKWHRQHKKSGMLIIYINYVPSGHVSEVLPCVFFSFWAIFKIFWICLY